MSYSNYSQIESAIRARVPFTGNSSRGYYEGAEYVVVSYNTAIARATSVRVVGATWAECPGGLYINQRKYSQTTTRLQNIVKRAWGLN